jgi:hypothetical protein
MVFNINNPFGMPSFSSSVKSNKIKKPKNFKKTPAMGVGSMPQPSWYGSASATKAVKANTYGAGSNSRLKQASKNKVASMAWAVNTGAGGIGEANRILSEMGRGRVSQIVTRRRRGRWSTKLSHDVGKVIKDYNRQKNLVEWGQSQGLKLDPKRTKSVIATTTQKSYYSKGWCHNNRCRGGGTKYYNVHTYKDVLVSENSTKGERWNMLEAKLVSEADKKKSRYVKLYDPLNVRLERDLKTATGEDKRSIENQLQYVRYSYFGIKDKELTESETYKRNLITGIQKTDQVTDAMRKGMSKAPDGSMTKEEYDKMKIAQLETEYDKEQAQFATASEEVQKRQTVFEQSSQVSKPNTRIVQLATQKQQATPTRPQNILNKINNRTPEINKNTPSSTQRGEGFKRFQKW